MDLIFENFIISFSGMDVFGRKTVVLRSIFLVCRVSKISIRHHPRSLPPIAVHLRKAVALAWIFRGIEVHQVRAYNGCHRVGCPGARRRSFTRFKQWKIKIFLAKPFDFFDYFNESWRRLQKTLKSFSNFLEKISSKI